MVVAENIKQSADTPQESSETSNCRRLLEKMAGNWHRRAQSARARENVARDSQPDMLFDPERDDFRVDLLPFKDHPDFLAAPRAVQKRILSCGWIAYNEKTIDIESKVIAPACNHIIDCEVPGVDDGTSQMIASETLVDEAYHVQLVISACRTTRQQRQLEHLRLPSFNLVKNMKQEQSLYSEPWQKILVQMATAIVSEVFVSDYLALLAFDKTVQPLNRLTVYTHFRDEKAHHSIFKGLATCMYERLTPEQQGFFAEVLPKPVRWFANVELEVWQAMLEQIGFSQTERMIRDCASQAEVNLLRIDYSDITSLADELGILDSERGVESFAKAGLLS
ncbi:MAG: diiron oxygenase [Cyanobacteria bacterium J06642_2]